MDTTQKRFTDRERLELQWWALENLRENHAGELVVLFGKQIIASGFDEDAICRQANEWAAKEKLPKNQLVFVVIPPAGLAEFP